MGLLFWCRKNQKSVPLPQWTPVNERPTWATAPTDVYPTNSPGRAGNPTPAQEWRANGGNW